MANQGHQGALVISADPDKTPLDIIKLSVNRNESELDRTVLKFDGHEISSCRWHLDTKYYEADIFFFEGPAEHNLIGKEFADSIEAVILYFNSNRVESFNLAKSWLPYIAEYDPEIKIVACDTVNERTTVKRLEVQHWSIDNGFEVVELNPDTDSSNDDVEDCFQESNSFRRILEALSAHAWPNLTMKSTYNYKPSEKFQSTLDEKSVADEMERLGLNGDNGTASKAATDTSTEEDLAKLSRNLEEGAFEELFSHFQGMKEKAAGLGQEERRKFAEQTAMAFWRALGGEEENEDSSTENP